MVPLGWILLENQDLGFLLLAVAVVVIALVLWFLRSIVELHPDPFFLNLTFFAFAAQCIRTVEALQENKGSRSLFGFFLAAVVLLGFELIVMKKHEILTILRYQTQLEEANREMIDTANQVETKSEAWQRGEINRWAKLLVKIAGTDFMPGSLWLLGEPKEKSKEEAISILPAAHFNQTSQYLEPNELNVSDPDRTRWGFLYLLFPALSWLVYVGALFVSR
jgi:hypothetical protein